ncbi:hypothetical protein CDD81_3335 [Ophiocordyceps australis]|uniref:Ecp2 effector protein-like domain-containing protein n=1 Tax=Ophiocordyceps australis TaxID=1399860 RepID=A0A2C5XVA8_9HYPO|nr:hypothetical protein CDD81_3335 [Ophiocordyceps australis]
MKLLLSSCAIFLALPFFALAIPTAVQESDVSYVEKLQNKTVALEVYDQGDTTSFRLRKRTNQCGHSTFENRGSEASPLISDCETLMFNIRKDGRWRLSTGVHRTVATFGTCAFGAQVRKQWYTYIGHEDIIDLIRDSIRDFRRGDGKVGSRGEMQCRGDLLWANVEWGLYHT